MANVSTNPLGFLFGSSNAEAKELSTGLIKIRGGTILLRDKIINIRNISSVEVISMAISFPWIVVFFILIGIFSLGIIVSEYFPVALLGLLVGAWGIVLSIEYLKKLDEYGLLILLNSGVDSSTLITNIDIEFLKQIARTLYNIISTDDERYVNIYVDQKEIVNIENITKSIISTGTITGDLVNSVD